MKANASGVPVAQPAIRGNGGQTRLLMAVLGLISLLGGTISADAQTEANDVPTRYPLMQLAPEEMAELVASHFRAALPPRLLEAEETFATSLSLLSRLAYVPAERDQGHCGNCWAWAGTGVMEIALDVQGVAHDRLSVQFINSCGSRRACCQGGWLEDVANFYTGTGYAVPWTNRNAAWRSGGGSCSSTPCGSIGTTPRYAVTRATFQAIPTHGVGQAQAIANIKSALNHDRAVWFGYFMPSADWSRFFDFWDSQTESVLWSGFNCGGSWNGGHAVLCVGYNEDAAVPYWIMLNSWGTAGERRPNGLFRVPMNINYECANSWGYYGLYWQTLDVRFTSDTVDLPEALNTSGLDWSTGGSAGWSGQRTISHDGTDAAESGAVGDNQESWLQTTIAGPRTVSFWWKVSSEANYDYLRLLVDGVEVAKIGGEVDWTRRSVELADGTHTLRWRYTKDYSESHGSDRGWVDQVVVGPPSAHTLVYVDARYTLPDADGTQARPYPRVVQGYERVADRGTVRIRAGAYAERLLFHRPMTLEAYDGLVRIGVAAGARTEEPGGENLPNPKPIRLSPPRLGANGSFGMTFDGEVGRRYQVFTSVDLSTWELWEAFMLESETLELALPPPAGEPTRFFKIVAP